MAKNSLLIVVALIFAAIVTFLFYSQQNTKPVTLSVLVAKQNLTSGTKIKTSDITWKKWPEKYVHDNYILENSIDPSALNNKVLRSAANKDQPITTDMLAMKKPSTDFASLLKPGLHAMVMPLASEISMARLLKTGDHVDLLLTRRVPGEGEKSTKKTDATYVSVVLLHNVPIIAVNGLHQPSSSQVAAFRTQARQSNSILGTVNSRTRSRSTARGPSAAKNITIAVNTEQAEIISVARKVGDITILLSSKQDPNELLEKFPYKLSNQIGYQRPNQTRKFEVLRGTQQQQIVIRK